MLTEIQKPLYTYRDITERGWTKYPVLNAVVNPPSWIVMYGGTREYLWHLLARSEIERQLASANLTVTHVCAGFTCTCHRHNTFKAVANKHAFSYSKCVGRMAKKSGGTL
jgi:hypothetical protein